jgi:hypothetical protein
MMLCHIICNNDTFTKRFKQAYATVEPGHFSTKNRFVRQDEVSYDDNLLIACLSISPEAYNTHTL